MPACTARMRQGRAVARAAGPRHHRPRLRPCLRRRGQASAASSTRKARARMVDEGSPVCAAARGLVRAAAETAPPLDCPRARLGCPATFRPPVGAATRSNSRCALPSLIAPQGAYTEGTGAAALCPGHWFLPPLNPLQGALRIARAPGGKRLCRSCLVPAVAQEYRRGFRRRLGTPLAPESGAARPVSIPLRSFLALKYFAMYCRRAPASRPGRAARTSRTAPAGWPPAQTGG